MLPLVYSGRLAAARTPESDRQFRNDLNAIASSPTRTIGSGGYERAATCLRGEIRALTNVELREQEYSVLVPVTDQSALYFDDASVEPVYPFWPAAVRLNSTPPQGI